MTAAGLSILTVGGARGFTSTFLVRAAAARGHRVSVLTRGLSPSRTDLPQGIEVLIGDRSGDLSALSGRDWDAVVDFGAFHPEDVTAITDAIRDRTTLYLLISTIMTYAPDAGTLDESSALLDRPDLEAIPPGWKWLRYGRGKVLAEQRAADLSRPVLVVRPGVIAGPGDPIAHLQYWYERWRRPGEILVPGTPDDPMQFIDARDLASWLASMIERRRTGTFNAVGPDRPTTMGDLMLALACETGRERSVVWIDSRWLSDRGVRSDGGPFFWVKPDDIRAPDEFWISYRVSDARARAEGLVSRPLAETVRDGLALPPEPAGQGGWAGEIDEAALIDEWRRTS